MPDLLIFAPCDNVLINKVGDSASLIVILTQFTYPKPADDNIPLGSILPLRWFIFCQWLIRQEDFGFTFQQKLQIGDNDEEPIMATEQDFATEIGRVHHRMVAGIPGFPVLPPGIYPIKVSVRRKDEKEWRLAGTYPIGVSYSEQPIEEIS